MLRNSSLIVKLFSVIFVCMSLLYISFQIILLKRSSVELAFKESEAYLSALQNGNTVVNEYFDSISDMMFLLEKQIDLYGTEKLESFLVKYKSQISIFSQSVYFIDPDNRIFSTDPAPFTSHLNARILDFNDKAQSSPSMGFSDPYLANDSSETLAVYRALPGNGVEYGGTIVVEIDLAYFKSRLQAALAPNSPTLDLILVTSYQDFPVAFFASPGFPLVDATKTPLSLDAGFLESAKAAMVNQETGMVYGGQSMLVYYRSLIRAPFNLCLIASADKYKALFDSVRADFFLNITIGTLLIVVAATLLTAITTNPLRKLVAEMDKVGSLVDLKPIEYRNRDEFSALVTSYNSLLARICGLIEDLKQSEHQKKVLELKTLQSQIGPHFLYNTLACFGSLAKQGKLDRLKEGIRNLIFLMGYSFDRIDDKVTLKDEIRILESYCQIQKLRYGEVFDIQLLIAPETDECILPKLILQPLVENAIFHGILPKYSPGSISIRSELLGNKLMITIKDDGVGMNTEQLSNLFSGYAETKFNKIGINNVDERIKLNFGDEFGLSVISRENAETVVTIILPAVLSSQQPQP